MIAVSDALQRQKRSASMGLDPVYDVLFVKTVQVTHNDYGAVLENFQCLCKRNDLEVAPKTVRSDDFPDENVICWRQGATQ